MATMMEYFAPGLRPFDARLLDLVEERLVAHTQNLSGLAPVPVHLTQRVGNRDPLRCKRGLACHIGKPPAVRRRRCRRRWFVEILGYTPIEALVAATKLGGELMGQGDKLGQIKAGYLADLLVVDGDPTRDVRILQDASKLALIMKDGKVHKRTAKLAKRSKERLAKERVA